MIKFYTSIFFMLSIGLAAFSQSFSSPESVEFDVANNRYLVSNRGATKSIQAVVPGQSPTLFTSNVSSPAGLEILGGKLWVCDGGRMKSFDLTTGALVDNVNVGATFLNGITSDGDHFLFVSDFSAKKIYRLNTLDLAFNEMVGATVTSPNGMWYDGANNRLVFVNWGASAAIKAVSLADSTISTITPSTMGNCDGVGRDVSGNYFISAWNQQSVYKYDGNFANPQAVVTGLANPADIFYNALNDTLAVPNAQNNTVTFHYLGSAGIEDQSIVNNELKLFPNPANDFTSISFELIEPSLVQMEIFDLNGLLVKRMEEQFLTIGKQQIKFNTNELPSGLYLYNIHLNQQSFKGQLTVLH